MAQAYEETEVAARSKIRGQYNGASSTSKCPANVVINNLINLCNL